MTNTHRHEWAPAQEGVLCGWAGCPARLDWDEIYRRLNATECLSAEDALSAADYCGDTITDYEPENTALRAYAKALEDK